MTSKDTPPKPSAGPYNFDKFRIDLEEIGRTAKTPSASSVGEATPKSPTLTFTMSEEKSGQSGKILGGAKLTYDNHIFWFDALDFWSIQRRKKWR